MPKRIPDLVNRGNIINDLLNIINDLLNIIFDLLNIIKFKTNCSKLMSKQKNVILAMHYGQYRF